jgi:hypothetical protein
MIKNVLLFLVILVCQKVVNAQSSEAPTHIQFRAVLHNPAKPITKFFFTDKGGNVVPLELLQQELASPKLSLLSNSMLVLYDKINVDPKNPEASIAATCKIPIGTNRSIIIILPSPANTKPAYRMVCIDDSAKEFPKGESRVLTLISNEAAIEAGEHKLPIHPSIITHIPLVKKVNEYNMAQTNFFYKVAEAWMPITERQLQYLEGYRRIFILHVAPGAAQPSITTLLDTTSPTAPLLTR